MASPAPSASSTRPAAGLPLLAMWMWLGGALVLAGTAVVLFVATILGAPSSTDVCGEGDSTVGECYLAVHQDHVYVRELSTVSLGLAAAAAGCLVVAAIIWLARRP